MFKLVISDDEGKTTIVPFIRDEVTIGRKEGNTIRLTDRNVSRFHARVLRKDDSFVIEDLGSLCGTKINSKLLKSESGEISTGDKVSIGDYSLSIRTDVGSDVPMGKQIGPSDETGIGKVSPHARLVILNGSDAGRDVELKAELYVVGRSEEANFRIKDQSISRAHARLDLETGKWTISDLDSINGILINGQKKDDYLLKAGDIVELGSVRLRFVAPGEPYEYEPTEQAFETASHSASVPVAKSSSKKLLLVLGIAGVLAIIAILIGISLFDGRRTSIEKETPEPDEALTYQALMEKGKDAMQAEDWRRAASLFALAQQKKPDSQAAREMKRIAIDESDSQILFNDGLEAEANGNLKEALEKFQEIPNTSHYFDAENLKKISGKLCRELLDKVKLAISEGEYSAANDIIQEIGAMTEAPRRCHRQNERLWKQLMAKDPSGGAQLDTENEVGPSKRTAKTAIKQKQLNKAKPPSGKSPINPYARRGSGSRIGLTKTVKEMSAGSKGVRKLDPVSRARAAMQSGDFASAIAILEQSGDSRQVLVLLAQLYMKTGNKQGYERTARKFIQLYPNDPASERFRRYL